MICRGMRFKDEDDAHDYFEQEKLDDAADALTAYEESLKKKSEQPEQPKEQ